MRQRWIAAACAAAWMTVALPAWSDDISDSREEIFERADAIEENPEGLSDSERLAAFLEVYFDYAMLEFPEFATFIGHPTGHDRWTDNSLTAAARREGEQERALEILRSIDRSALDGEERLNYDLLEQTLVDGVRGAEFDGDYLVLNQLNGVHQNVSQMAAIMPTFNTQGYDDLLDRLRGVGALVDNDLEALRIGLEKGVTPPQITLRDVPGQVEALLTDDPMERPLL